MILCTFPGKAGDILWSLPTVRAISRHHQERVDMVIGKQFQDLVELLRLQPYIRYAWADPEWDVRFEAPASPREPPASYSEVFESSEIKYEQVYHLGYKGWPVLPLPYEIASIAGEQGARLEGFTLDEPWITPPPIRKDYDECDVAVGFTDCWVELKAGIIAAVAAGSEKGVISVVGPPGARLLTEFGLDDHSRVWCEPGSYLDTTRIINASKLFLGCLSSKAVLARGMGKPCVLVEPMEGRHSSLFHGAWHPGIVIGNDRKPTFDARAVVEAVKKRLVEIEGGQA